jgi:HlyD family secretion protein
MRELLKPSRQFLPKRFTKLFIYLLIALITGFLIVVVFRPTPVSVNVGQVERGELQITVDAEGKTRVRDRYIIAAGVSGHLDRITLNEGDPVSVGTVVAQIDPLPQTAAVQEALGRLAEWQAQRAGVETQRPKAEALAQAQNQISAAVAQQQQAEASVAQAQSALAQARRDAQRAQQLEATGAISRQQREQAELDEQARNNELAAATQAAQAAASEVAVAQEALALLQAEQRDPDYLLRVYDARIASVEAELAQLQDEAQRTQMRSPIQGQVLRVLQRSTQFVSEGTPLLELSDPTELELVVDVLSTDAERISAGQQMLIGSGTHTSPLQGQVRRVEPSAFTKVSALGIEEQRVNVIGDFIDSPLGLGDAYRVDVRIVVWEQQNTLKAPLSALFRCEQSWCTFVVKDGKADRRMVQIGQRSDSEVEIQQGLEDGEALILHPTEQIQDGDAVTVR